MGQITPLQIGVKSSPGRYGHEGDARLINCYTELLGEEGKSQIAIDAIPGYSLFSTVDATESEARALLEVDNALYVVMGRNLYSVNNSGNVTTIGGIAADGLVSIARNRTTVPQIAIVSNGLWYVCQGGTLTQGSDADLPAPIYVVEMDGYFVYIIADGRVFVSGINDGLTIDPLAFGKADKRADGLNAAAVRGDELVLFGTKSAEFHRNVGTTPWPFERVHSIDYGCYAAGSVIPANIIKGESAIASVIWAASDAQGAHTGVMLLNGYTPVKISPHWVDRLIEAEAAVTNMHAYTRTHGGHVFYKLSGENFTVAYNTVTGYWHEEKSYGLVRSRIQKYAFFGGKHILGDYENGQLYQSTSTEYEEAGNPLIATVQPPLVHAFPHQIRVDALYLDIVPGVGLVTGDAQDVTPEVMISYSQDGGKNFGPERRVSVGAAAQWLTTITERMFGLMHKNGVTFRFSFSAAVVKRFLGVVMDATTVPGR